jgi:hypothetical protein
VIEPLIVCPWPSGKFLVLDGLVRLSILKEFGAAEADCLIATDDEAFTYNRRVNHLPPVQEHRMILRAIKKGVTEEHIALALNINMTTLRQKRRLLDGICPEVVDMIKDRHVALNVFPILRRMKPVRQIECVELMISISRLTASYARSMLAATSREQLSEVPANKGLRGLGTRKMALMERETAVLDREYADAEKSYGRINLDLTIAKGYVARLLVEGSILQYMIDHHIDLLVEIQKICPPKDSATSPFSPQT